MPRLRLIDAGLPYKKIMKGSHWIGRVYKNANGSYTGTIGKGASRLEATAPSEQGAFNEVGARFFGQPSAEALAQHNAEVRTANRNAGRQRNAMLNDFLRDIGLTLGGRRGGRVTAQRIGTPGGESAVRVTVEPELDEDDFVTPASIRSTWGRGRPN